MKKTFLLLSFILFFVSGVYAENKVAVIPYKIANPTDEFTTDTGNDYAKLISIAAAVSKDVSIINHKYVYDALKKLSINSQRIITEENMIEIGKMCSADYILIGTLSRARGSYISESLLYSTLNNKIMARCRMSSGSMLKLASDEMSDIFFTFPGRDKSSGEKYVETALLIDLSYKISTEWESIKKGIIDFTDDISENWSIDTGINIIPFSEKYPEIYKNAELKSPQPIAEKLKKLVPAGTNSAASFNKALNYAVKNIPWKRTSDKILIIISNSENINGRYIEQYALEAKAKKISIYTIGLGLLNNEDIEALRRFSTIGKGRHYNAAYHQRFYNESGNPVDFFLQGGRLFESPAYDEGWRSGLFENKTGAYNPLEKPKSFLDEIFYDEKKYNLNPYNLSKNLPMIARANIINAEKPEDNIDSILRGIASYSFGKSKYVKPIAKVLLSDGKISVWAKVKKDEDLAFFERHDSTSFPLGVIIKRRSAEPYGIALDPDSLMIEFPDDFIPSMVKTSFSKITKDPGRYTSIGLLNPPLWFIDVRVQKIEKLRKEYDIREIGR